MGALYDHGARLFGSTRPGFFDPAIFSRLFDQAGRLLITWAFLAAGARSFFWIKPPEKEGEFLRPFLAAKKLATFSGPADQLARS